MKKLLLFGLAALSVASFGAELSTKLKINKPLEKNSVVSVGHESKLELNFAPITTTFTYDGTFASTVKYNNTFNFVDLEVAATYKGKEIFKPDYTIKPELNLTYKQIKNVELFLNNSAEFTISDTYKGVEVNHRLKAEYKPATNVKLVAELGGKHVHKDVRTLGADLKLRAEYQPNTPTKLDLNLQVDTAKALTVEANGAYEYVASEKLTITPKLQAKLGATLGNFSETNTLDVTPAISLSYKLNPSLTLSSEAKVENKFAKFAHSNSNASLELGAKYAW